MYTVQGAVAGEYNVAMWQRGQLSLSHKDAGDMCVRQHWHGLQHDFVAMYPLFAFVRCEKKIQHEQQQEQTPHK